MPSAVKTVTLIQDGLSPGILRQVTLSADARLELLKSRMEKMNTLLGVLINSDDVDDDMAAILSCLHDLVEGAQMVCGGDLREYRRTRYPGSGVAA